jgi:hypothetical protein
VRVVGEATTRPDSETLFESEGDETQVVAQLGRQGMEALDELCGYDVVVDKVAGVAEHGRRGVRDVNGGHARAAGRRELAEQRGVQVC